MKRFYNIVTIAAIFIAASGLVYYIHYLIFGDPHHIFIYLVGDLGFVFLEVFLVIIGLELAWAIVWLFCEGNITRIIEFWASDTVGWVACFAAVGIIAGTLWKLFLVKRQKLIGTKALLSMALVFPVVVVSLWASLMWTEIIGGLPSMKEGFYILGTAAAPFIPLATVSLSIAKQRHR